MPKHQIIIRDKHCMTDLSPVFSKLKNGTYFIDIYDSDCKTSQQMRLYRGPLIDILKDYTGYGHDECNNIFKHKFLDVETINIEGVEYKILPSLENISKVKFSKFIDCVVEYLETLGLNPPRM